MDILTLVLILLIGTFLMQIVRGGQIHFPVMSPGLAYVIILILLTMLILRVVLKF